MRVYRCISAREIMSKYKNTSLPKKMAINQNTHNYKKRTSYIHFFRYQEFAEYYFKLQQDCSIDPLDRYVLFMTANIPNELLYKYSGYGFYSYPNELFGKIKIPVPEYAIPLKEFKQDYIVEINDKISFSCGSKNGEFQRYLVLMKQLLDKYKDCNQISQFLIKNDLSELLDVKDDNRTEIEMKNDAIRLVNEYMAKNNIINDEVDEEIKEI